MKCIIAVIAVALFAACVNAGDYRFQDKVILVTGGSSGIGFQTALMFAQEGGHVIITARDSNTEHYSLDNATKTINEDPAVALSGGTIRSFQADVSDPVQAKKLFDNIRATEGVLHIAVNGAGISGPIGHLAETSEYTMGEHDPIKNNVYSAMYALLYEELIMFENRVNGSIVNIAAIQGITPNSTIPRYVASKHAIIGLAKSIGLRHITGEDGVYIRVNNIAPGITATPLLFNMVKGSQPWEGEWVTEDSETWKNALGGVVEHTPMGRVARPSEVASTILWLCTEDASYISAATILVDGGFWAT